MMVTMVVMIVVLFALYSIFDMSIRIFSFGNDTTEAVENARLGLEKMERELRGAYPLNRSADATDFLFWTPGSNPTSGIVPSGQTITFGNDLNGNGRIDIATEAISYRLGSAPNATDPRPLERVVGFPGTSSPVVESLDGATGVTFTPLKKAEDNCTGCTAGDVSRIRIQIRVKVDEGTQTLTSDVALRNSRANR